jgi:hypothetical protein
MIEIITSQTLYASPYSAFGKYCTFVRTILNQRTRDLSTYGRSTAV